MVGLDTIIFGIIIVIAVYLTYLISKFRKRYMEDTVIRELDNNPELQKKIKDRYGWK